MQEEQKPFFETKDQEICILNKPSPNRDSSTQLVTDYDQVWMEEWKNLEQDFVDYQNTPLIPNENSKQTQIQNEEIEFHVTKVSIHDNIVLLGIDNLFVDNLDTLQHLTWKTILSPYGYTITEKEYSDWFQGQYSMDTICHLLPFTTSDEISLLLSKKQDLFIQTAPNYMKQQQTISSLQLILQEAKNHFECFIVTDLFVKEMQWLINHYNLSEYISGIFSSQHPRVKQCKPHPTIYHFVASQLHQQSIATLESSKEGVMSAAYANMSPIIGLVLNTSNEQMTTTLKSEMLNNGACVVIDQLEHFEMNYLFQL